MAMRRARPTSARVLRSEVRERAQRARSGTDPSGAIAAIDDARQRISAWHRLGLGRGESRHRGACVPIGGTAAQYVIVATGNIYRRRRSGAGGGAVGADIIA